MRQLNNIMRQRKDDPINLNKGDPNKVWNYELIKSLTFSEDEDCMVKPRKSYATDNTQFNQLDFPVNYSLFVFYQYKLAENYQDKEEFKKMKIRFHAVLGNSEEESWSLVKITKFVSITSNVLL